MYLLAEDPMCIGYILTPTSLTLYFKNFFSLYAIYITPQIKTRMSSLCALNQPRNFNSLAKAATTIV